MERSGPAEGLFLEAPLAPPDEAREVAVVAADLALEVPDPPV